MPRTVTIDISADDQNSTIADLGADARLTAILFPAAMTGVNVNFRASESAGGTFRDVLDEAGVVITLPFGANELQTLTQDLFRRLSGFRFIQIRSDAAELADRLFTLHVGRDVGR